MYIINFLSHRQRQLSKLEAQDKRILKISSVVFGVVALVTALLLGGRFYFYGQLAEAETREQQLKSNITSQEQTEEAFLFFINKLDALGTLFEQRRDKQAAIEYFSQVFGPAVVIDNIAYNAQDSNIEFGIKAGSVFALDQVFATLTSTETKSRFKSVVRKDLRRGSDGSYSLQVLVTFGSNEPGT